jgi:GNAT superfamily N-acetyltransferase
MGLVIRSAVPGEEGPILPMYEWLFAPPGVKPGQWDPDRALERIGEAISLSDSRIFVAEQNGALVGFCTAYLELNSVRFGQRCWVEDLAVDPQQRSRGVGSALLKAAQDWARSAGATHLELDSGLARVDAHRFYEREGATRQSYSFGWEL